MPANGIYQIPPIQNISNYPTEGNNDLSNLPSALMHPLPREPIIPTQQPHQELFVSDDDMPPETAHILDYTIWSRINVLLGAIVLGIIPLLLSIHRLKRANNVAQAKKWSSVNLGLNIFVSLVFAGAMLFLLTTYTTLR
jgi:hypothetical protein